MTTPDYFTPASSPAWQRYIARERAARGTYLAVIEHASNEYLVGPFPDREAFNVVENDAWKVYYSASRNSWLTYRQEIDTPPPPPPRAAGYAPNFPPDYRENVSGPGWSQSPVFIPTDESR